MKQLHVFFSIAGLTFASLTSLAHADMVRAQELLKEKNYQAAFREYMESAKGGNIYAQYIIAQMYANGEGVDRDMREAAFWYAMAADRGHLKSQNNLANMYMDGFGILQNFDEAARWFKRAADQGNYLSMASLAELYQYGYGVEQDYEKAIHLYETSAKAGIGKAMNNLGFMHFGGFGVTQSYQHAYMWFSVAELTGNTQGRINKFDMRDYLEESEKSQAEGAAQEWIKQHPNAMPEKTKE